MEGAEGRFLRYTAKLSEQRTQPKRQSAAGCGIAIKKISAEMSAGRHNAAGNNAIDAESIQDVYFY